MEEAIKDFMQLISQMKAKSQESTPLPPPTLVVQKPAKKEKRAYTITHADSFQARMKKAVRATELRHLLNRLKTLESTIEGMEKFLKDAEDPEFSFNGQFDSMIQRIRDESVKVKRILGASAAPPTITEVKEAIQEVKQELASVEQPTEVKEETLEETAPVPTVDAEQQPAFSTDKLEPEPSPSAVHVSEAVPQAIPQAIPQATPPAATPSTPSKRKRLFLEFDDGDFDDKTQEPVFFTPEAGVIHQNTTVRAFGNPVGRSVDEALQGAPQIQIRTPPVKTDFSSYFRNHLRR